MYKYIYLVIILSFSIISCNNPERSSFSREALLQNVFNQNRESYTIDEIIDQHQGKNLIIDIWASWCPDCIKSLTKISKFQKENPDVDFVFISVDDSQTKWENGVARYMSKFDVKGDHYIFPNGWDRTSDTPFIHEIGLNWIPRYILIGKNGEIKVYNAKSINQKNIIESL